MELRWVNLSRLLHLIDTTKESDESIQFADVYFGPQMFFCIRYQDELVYEANLSMIKFCFLCFFIRSYFSFASHDDWMSWFGTTHSYWWIAFGWAFQPAFAFAKAKSKRPKTHTYFCPKPVIEVDTSKLLFYCYTIEVWYHKWKIWAL